MKHIILISELLNYNYLFLNGFIIEVLNNDKTFLVNDCNVEIFELKKYLQNKFKKEFSIKIIDFAEIIDDDIYINLSSSKEQETNSDKFKNIRTVILYRFGENIYDKLISNKKNDNLVIVSELYYNEIENTLRLDSEGEKIINNNLIFCSPFTNTNLFVHKVNSNLLIVVNDFYKNIINIKSKDVILLHEDEIFIINECIAVERVISFSNNNQLNNYLIKVIGDVKIYNKSSFNHSRFILDDIDVLNISYHLPEKNSSLKDLFKKEDKIFSRSKLHHTPILENIIQIFKTKNENKNIQVNNNISSHLSLIRDLYLKAKIENGSIERVNVEDYIIYYSCHDLEYFLNQFLFDLIQNDPNTFFKKLHSILSFLSRDNKFIDNNIYFVISWKILLYLTRALFFLNDKPSNFNYINELEAIIAKSENCKKVCVSSYLPRLVLANLINQQSFDIINSNFSNNSDKDLLISFQCIMYLISDNNKALSSLIEHILENKIYNYFTLFNICLIKIITGDTKSQEFSSLSKRIISSNRNFGWSFFGIHIHLLLSKYLDITYHPCPSLSFELIQSQLAVSNDDLLKFTKFNSNVLQDKKICSPKDFISRYI